MEAIKKQEDLACQISNMVEMSAALVINSDKKQVKASSNEAEGEVDWFSKVAEECGEASDDGWGLDNKSNCTTQI